MHGKQNKNNLQPELNKAFWFKIMRRLLTATEPEYKFKYKKGLLVVKS